MLYNKGDDIIMLYNKGDDIIENFIILILAFASIGFGLYAICIFLLS